jgi:hypothetical protein
MSTLRLPGMVSSRWLSVIDSYFHGLPRMIFIPVSQ